MIIPSRLSASRLPAVESRTGCKKSTIYPQIQAGLFPPQFNLGLKRHSVWLDHEVDAVIAARAAGGTDEEVRALVRELVNSRRDLVEALRTGREWIGRESDRG